MAEGNKGKNSKKKIIRDLSKLSELKEVILGSKPEKLRLAKVAKEFNISIKAVVEVLRINGRRIDQHPMEIISDNEYKVISQVYESEKLAKEEAKQKGRPSRTKKENLKISSKDIKELKKENIGSPNLIKPIDHVPIPESKIRRPRIKRMTNSDSNILPKHNNSSKEENNKSPKSNAVIKDISQNYIGQIFFIYFEQNKAFMAKYEAISFNDINFPNKIKMFKRSMSCRVKIIKYVNEQKKLIVDIISYHKGHQQFSPQQLRAQDFLYNIKSVIFRNIDINYFLQFASGNQTADVVSAVNPIISNIEESISDERTFNEKFRVDFKEIKFGIGKVVFKRRISFTGRFEELSIANPHIREEFNSIKSYFQKVLEIKEINVEVMFRFSKGPLIVTSTIATSPEIDRINENLISVVKIGIIKKALKNQSSLNKSFTIDKMLESNNDKIKSNTFYTEESQFLDDILTIKIKPTKHDNHLKYLASRQSLTQKLHFFIKPFSFIFLLDGIERNYIVWETLDTSEATYLWDIDNNTISLQENFRKIESIILSIKNGGKQKYIETTKDSYQRVFHNYSESKYGFSSWKTQLDSYIK